MLEKDELSELKGQFLTNLNHEIRTPLSGILGMTDLLVETQLTDEQSEYVNAARLCAENLLATLNTTLEYSALSANHLELEEIEFPTRETVQGVVSEFIFKAQSKGLEIRQDLDASLPPALIGDPMRLRQLIWHLVGNAVKFTERGHVGVRVTAEPLEPGRILLRIAIQDTGIGIPAGQIDSIFESFCQLETGLSRNYPGLGLGLAVAKKLALLLNGEITVQSRVGEGSTFTVKLPVRLSLESEPQPVNLQRIRGRILVVDDNSVAQTIASHFLRRHAYDVECVTSGLAAIDKASRSSFDLIFMDLQMPGMDGFQTVKHIRDLPSYSATPIIALTANCSGDYRDRCLSQGMQGFLSKPVQGNELVQTVERYL